MKRTWDMTNPGIKNLLNDLASNGVAKTAECWPMKVNYACLSTPKFTHRRVCSDIMTDDGVTEEEVDLLSECAIIIMPRSSVAENQDGRSKETLMVALKRLQHKYTHGINPALFDLRGFPKLIVHGRPFDFAVYFHVYILQSLMKKPFTSIMICDSIIHLIRLFMKERSGAASSFPISPNKIVKCAQTTYNYSWMARFVARFHISESSKDARMSHVLFLCANEELQVAYVNQNGNEKYRTVMLENLKKFVESLGEGYGAIHQYLHSEETTEQLLSGLEVCKLL